MKNTVLFQVFITIIQILDMTETYRDICIGVSDTYLQCKQQDQRYNENINHLFHHIHTINLYCRGIWHEFQVLPGVELEIFIFRLLGYITNNNLCYVKIF